MKKISNYITYWLLLFLGFVSSFLSIGQRTSIGKLIGNFLKFADKKRAEITYINLKQAFPEKSVIELKQIVMESYQNLGITMTEFATFKYFTHDDFEKYVKYENIELIESIHKRNKGLILISGHFGNWELLAFSAGLFSELGMNIVVKPQSNRIVDEKLNSYRTIYNNKLIPMGNAARPLINIIRNKGIIAFLVDQSAPPEEVFVNFFGRPAATYEAPAMLALKFDVPIIMGFAERLEDGTYFVKLLELEHSDLKFNKEGIRELTKRHVEILEIAVRKMPGHWAWQHKRWKHIPVGGKHE